MNQVTRNKNRGLDFEYIFHKKVLREGYGVIKNHITAKWVPFPRRRLIAIPGDLDFKILDKKRGGKVYYFDCKCYNDEKFAYSQLDPDQVERACLYNDFKITAGFIVYFIPLNKVVFFSGYAIVKKGSRNSFRPEDGILLGGLVDMRLDVIFGAPSVASSELPHGHHT